MPRNIVETLLGAAVLAVALGFLAWAYGRSDAGDPGGYTLRAKFDRVDGLETGGGRAGSPGIKVGKVLARSSTRRPSGRQVTFSVRRRHRAAVPTARPPSSAAACSAASTSRWCRAAMTRCWRTAARSR